MRTQPTPAKPRVDHNAEWDKPEEEAPRHHASDVRDRGLLDALGKAIVAPVIPKDQPAQQPLPAKD